MNLLNNLRESQLDFREFFKPQTFGGPVTLKDVIKSVSSQEYEIVTSSVKDILIGERTVESRNGSVYYKAVLFAENVCYQDRFLVFEKDLAELLKYFGIK